MNEVLMWKGLLVELKRKAREKESQAAAIIISMRMMLNPHETDITKLNVEEIENAGDLLRKLVEEIREMKAQMEKLETSING
jgi:hypothetical protein